MPLLKYLFRARAGKYTYWYFRHGGVYERIKAPFGTPEFAAKYAELLKQSRDDKDRSVSLHQWGGLRASYKKSLEWQQLAPRTRKSYDEIIKLLDDCIPEKAPVAQITRQVVIAIRDKFADRPRTSVYTLQVLSVMMRYAADINLIDRNPCAGVRKPSLKSRTAIWDDESIALVLSCSDNIIITAFMLALHTGQRRGDVLRLTWAQYDGQAFAIRQSKTGAAVHVPVTRQLKQHLDALKKQSTHIVLDASGKPTSDNAFRIRWEKMRSKLGLEGLQFRDLRRTAVVNLAEAGCTVPEIAAITGHKINETQKIIETYWVPTRLQAQAAITKLDNYRQAKSDKTLRAKVIK